MLAVVFWRARKTVVRAAPAPKLSPHSTLPRLDNHAHHPYWHTQCYAELGLEHQLILVSIGDGAADL
jgi:hypothetical protein